MTGAICEHQRAHAAARLSASPGCDWAILTWSWDGTPEKARREVVIDPGAEVVRVLRGSRDHMIQLGSLTFPGTDKVTTKV